MYTEYYLVVDLATGEAEEVELEEEFVEQYVGGAKLNLALYDKYKDEDPIVFGSGLFTSTLIPGSCLGVLTAKSPLTGKVAHASITWNAGAELKFTGYSFVVVKNKAAEPTYLWLHDEIADFVDASSIWGKDTWEATDAIRDEQGEDRIQLLIIGKAGENKLTTAQVINNYWGDGDRFGFGALFGEKNLKAIAMRGMGELELDDADAFLEKAEDLFKDVVAKVGAAKGFDAADYADISADLKAAAAKQTHRVDADFNSPLAYKVYLKYREDPSVMDMTDNWNPGVLVSDPIGFAAIGKAVNPDAAGEVLEKVFRLGLNPVAVASKLTAKDAAGAIAELEKLAESSEAEKFDAVFSPMAPESERTEAAYIAGICPVLAAKVDTLNADTYAELASLTTGLDFDADAFKM
ncbi:MAG TPA: aldehyde ferredoxin oxidoreductase N-terminal domain-containing protein [Candidatus Methanofastidiosa archaeon]|nr:aldehyde ferredoxin oxidoreductase N-terminal domain-containing protein [Candidatus Methanofastidiosa archaeon]HPR42258.1 aldehyde ferredoxin oxidoreductase N-terminal domain-containing protein [Candidatus Methanofastidiosa archaeon]